MELAPSFCTDSLSHYSVSGPRVRPGFGFYIHGLLLSASWDMGAVHQARLDVIVLDFWDFWSESEINHLLHKFNCYFKHHYLHMMFGHSRIFARTLLVF